MSIYKNIKRGARKMFREFLVYHNSSLEYRAKLITLMISSNGEISTCEKEKLYTISQHIYHDDPERAETLIDTINEYHTKIVTNNGLNFEHLIQLVIRDTKDVKRFSKKIDIKLLKELFLCTKNEEDRIFQERILTFLQDLKDEYTEDI